MEWFKRSLSTSKTSKQVNQDEPNLANEDNLGVTQELIQHVKTFTVETFKNFPLSDEISSGSSYYGDEGEVANKNKMSGNVKKDLSEWQERHAVFVLSKVKELSQLRFKLCPRVMKEEEFWRVYFSLVNRYTAKYELQAIRLAKLKSMATENERASEGNIIEVEMAETKPSASLTPPIL